jgi:hypothetical protein
MITLTVNGMSESLDVDPATPLLYVARAHPFAAERFQAAIRAQT